jgi:hypothetical protein
VANRFIELVEAGRIADEAALKRAFRAAAKRAHPDTLAGFDSSGGAGSTEAIRVAESAARAFIALRADYEAALAYLGSRGAAAPAENAGPARGARPDIRPFSRGAFYESLEDLLARGFPRRPRAAYPRAGYEESRARVLSYLGGRDQVFPEDRALAAFLSFEAGYAAIARPGAGWLSVENDPARSLYFVLSDIVLYHETGFAHTAAFARNVRPTTEALLKARGETRPLAFLAILVDDLDGGPACTK